MTQNQKAELWCLKYYIPPFCDSVWDEIKLSIYRLRMLALHGWLEELRRLLEDLGDC